MQTLAHPSEYAEEIKKSRFIARAAKALSVEDALAWIGRQRDPQATHNAWAYKIDRVTRFFDDGEVSGTAGKPILGALEKQGLDRIVVLVTRHYGGIKLGTGGLVRAYGGAAALCLRKAEKIEIRIMRRARLTLPFADQGRAFSLFEKLFIERLGQTFTESGVCFDIRLAPDREASLRNALRDLLRGGNPFWEDHGEEYV
ncbi:MAG: YigZ family protein [Candidatus Ozemobacteraceae bacterium]